MKRGVVVAAALLMALPLCGRASAKKLDEFQKKELKEQRQERKDTKAELQDEQRDEQEQGYERERERAGQRRRGEDLDDDDLDSGSAD